MLRSQCQVFYDAPNERLVYVGRPADEGYWDEHWLAGLTRKHITSPDWFVVDTTKRFLQGYANVVDAGCGAARTVYGLSKAGYQAYGVDFAPATVSRILELAPELRVSVADVRDMSEFFDGFFHGLWSLGVIEHFYDGYDAILKETHRLVRPGGYAFVTVPSMSPLRKWKAKRGKYLLWQGKGKEDFYQFILSPKRVIYDFERAGFKLVETSPRGGFKGLKDESGDTLRSIMQAIYDSKLMPVRALRAVLDKLLAPWTGHTRLFVFQRV